MNLETIAKKIFEDFPGQISIDFDHDNHVFAINHLLKDYPYPTEGTFLSDFSINDQDRRFPGKNIKTLSMDALEFSGLFAILYKDEGPVEGLQKIRTSLAKV